MGQLKFEGSVRFHGASGKERMKYTAGNMSLLFRRRAGLDVYLREPRSQGDKPKPWEAGKIIPVSLAI